MPLHLDYRPKTLDELFGNYSIKNSLLSIFERKDRPRAFMFYGPSGCGKTTIARIIANMLKCSSSDIFEYNSSNTRGIDTIREISQNVHYSGMMSRNKVYILDEVHQLTKEASHALLKVLEDTPEHVTFILCTTEPDKIIRAIHTRCTSYQVSTLDSAKMEKLLNWVLLSEGNKKFPAAIIKEIIKVSEGCPREALVILDQVVDIKNEKEALEAVSSFTVGESEVNEICQDMLQEMPWEKMKSKVASLVNKTEPEKLRYAVLGYISKVLLDEKKFTKPADFKKASLIIDTFSDNTYNTKEAGIINMFYLVSGGKLW